MYKDNYTEGGAEVSIAPAVHNSTVTGASVDLQGYYSASAHIQFGTRTDGTHAFTIEESSDNSAFTTVAAADLRGDLPTASSAALNASVQRIGYFGAKRYIRVKSTVTPGSTGAQYSAAIVLGHPRYSGVNHAEA